MTILRIDNTVQDYDSWKAAFDKFERVRADNGVRSYRISRAAADPRRVLIDLEFDGRDGALSFRAILEKIWASPQSQRELVEHHEPMLLDVVADTRL
jgi:hypothetical protein